MTRAEAIKDLEEIFGSVREVALPAEPGYSLVIIETAQPVPGGNQTTRVAFKLPADVTSRPQHFVEPHVHLANGGQPNNATQQELAGTLWKTWSLKTNWTPDRHRLSQLVYTVLKVWDR